MKAGLLNEIIEIWRSVEQINDYGEVTDEWQLHYTTRAQVSWSGGRRTLDHNEVVFDYTKTFTLRYYVDVTEKDIIKWQNNKYRILSIEHRRGFNGIIIQAELIHD